MGRTIVFLLKGATAAVEGEPFLEDRIATSFHATIRGSGTVSGTVVIEASNDSQADPSDILWADPVLGTITLAGTNSDSGVFGDVVPYLQYRARLTVISGTDAVVDVIMGV